MGKTLWAWLVCAVLCGCMSAPSNEGHLANTSVSVPFSGYALSPSSEVRLEVSLARGGPFVPFAVATSSASAITLADGTKLYPWKVKSAIPSWKSTCTGKETFIRARSEHGYFLFTYEAAGADGTPSGVACVTTKIAEGDPAVVAMAECASPDSPVVRLTADGRPLPSTHRGNVVVSTQAQADAYACVQTIQGSLTIGQSSELSIALPNLQVVTGDVKLAWVRDPLVSPFLPAVRAIGLPQLQTIGGELEGTYYGIAADYISFDMGLEGLTSVGGPIALELLNTSNGDLQGFDALLSHGSDLSVLGGTGDAAWYGLFPNLDSVAGHVHVRTGNSTYGVLRELTAIDGNLEIEGSLLHTEGLTGSFPLLASVSGDVLLQDIGTFGPNRVLQSLTSIGGELSVLDGTSSLQALQLGGAAGLEMQGLHLVNNPSLESFSDATWHVLGHGPIEIVDNTELPSCIAQSFVDAQLADGWTGVATVSGNAPCGP